MSKKKVEAVKIECPKCGNTTEFHCYGAASTDVLITWNKKKQKYEWEEVGHYTYSYEQFTCLNCGQDVDELILPSMHPEQAHYRH